MEPLFEPAEGFGNRGKNDRKNKFETERRIRELKEQHQLKRELDYFDYDEYDD